MHLAESECALRCGEEEETPDQIVVRLKDERGRREWVMENDLRWDI